MKDFSLSEPMYDMDTYSGRVKHFFGILDPIKSFHSKENIMKMNETIKQHLRLEQENKMEGKKPHVRLDEKDIKMLKEYKQICDASIHPDTGEVIPWFIRMNAFVPTNAPIIVGILIGPQTPMINAFWQWVN